MTIQVILVGAAGRMGQAAIRAIHLAENMRLKAALTRQTGIGQDAGMVAGIGEIGCQLGSELQACLWAVDSDPQVLVDLTYGESAYQNTLAALAKKIPVVIGATGLSEIQIENLRYQAETEQTGVLIAPNFSLGAVLMMKFAQVASQYFDWAEIIELHHEKKLDAPSGTAIKTAALMNLPPKNEFINSPTRGQVFSGVPIHSVRLPGLLAHQEVILGGAGQTLTIRHDSSDRVSFMPGMLMAIEKVLALKSLVYGLENFI